MADKKSNQMQHLAVECAHVVFANICTAPGFDRKNP